jgi:hypothetical protein
MEKGRRRGEVGLRTVGHVLQGLCHGKDIRFPVAELGRPKKMAIPLFSVSKQPISDHWGGCWGILLRDGGSLNRFGGVGVSQVCVYTVSKYEADRC